MRIRIEIDDALATAALQRLVRAAADMSPLMRAVAAHLEDSVLQSFQREASPAGAWAPLSPKTVRARGSSHPILVHTGQLRRSLVSDHGADWAMAGVLKTERGHNIARYLQEGTSRMPARPFLALWDDQRAEIVDEVKAFALRAWRG